MSNYMYVIILALPIFGLSVDYLNSDKTQTEEIKY